MIIKHDQSESEDIIQIVKTWIMSDMNAKWRQWKKVLQSEYYDKHKTAKKMATKINDHRVDKAIFNQ